ncbi:MAG: methyl-accepting chemotaxis protein [Lachnospiraceae bacterium]|nr:methyl-accepting chemotaxis protein [Lachnospiraceae bacterium]
MKKIQMKMLVGTLPVIIVAMLVLTLISSNSSSNIIDEQISNHMGSELEANMNSIEESLNIVKSTAMNISREVGTTYKNTELETYEEMLGMMIQDNDLVLGSGIWFEPRQYDPAEEYVGPYIFKDGDSVVTTYDYSNAEYDYFTQEYYTLANGATEPVITDPYYDATSGKIMASCTCPMYDEFDRFIGCVTVDMELGNIESIVSSIQVGEQGHAMMTTADGTYLSCEDSEKVSNALKITEEENTDLANAATQVLGSDSGLTSYRDGSEIYNLYYDTIPGVNWKLMIRMPHSELNAPVVALVRVLVLVCIVAILFCALAVILQVNSIAKNVNHVKQFAVSLAAGDFTIDTIHTKSKDELGQMSHALNDMYASNKDVISNISSKAGNIESSSNTLNDAVNQLLTNFEQIQMYMSEVNEAMMTSSAATEEVNASVEEVNSSVTILSSETGKSSSKANEIKKRANEIEDNSRKAYEYATGLSSKHEVELAKAVENAKVVENIGEMARAISEIAEQINLLSLNASIEAARAGEQGRGFAVVATEIGKLANDTSQTVSRIEETIADVHTAFSSMTEGTSAILSFLKETVTPDYNNFVEIAKQYGNDADAFEEISEKISEMTTSIASIMSEVSEAVQNVAESSQSTADSSGRIMDSVEEVSKIVENVSNMAGEQEQIAEDLNQVVSKFKL